MKKMIPSLPISIAVPALRDDCQFRIGDFGRDRRCERPTVQTIEVIHTQIVRRLGGLSDPRRDHDLFRNPTELGQRGLHDGQDGKIPASRTPGIVGPMRHVIEFLVDHTLHSKNFKSKITISK